MDRRNFIKIFLGAFAAPKILLGIHKDSLSNIPVESKYGSLERFRTEPKILFAHDTLSFEITEETVPEVTELLNNILGEILTKETDRAMLFGSGRI